MINKKLLIAIPLIVCVVVSTFVALQFVRAQETDAYVWVNPESLNVNVCDYFLIDVMIDVTVPLAADYDFFLSYDASAMTAVNAWDGGFLNPVVTFNWEILFDWGGLGIDAVHCWASTSDGGVIGIGTLATIEFHCLAPGRCPLTLEEPVLISDELGTFYSVTSLGHGWVNQYAYWEPIKLIDIVEWPYVYHLVDIPFVRPSSPEGYMEVLTYLEDKGYTFDPADGTASEVTMFIEEKEFTGTVTSWWSNNTLEDGTRACMLSAEMVDESSMAMGFVTNLLPPEQIPEVDPYIIVNAQPYLFVDFYWWAWHPIGRVVSYSYWWYNSHHHPNWFWGPYWWWRIYIKGYYYPYIDVPYWRPWWGWWWHWTYWRHWYWWSTYFPYDP